MSEKFGKYFMLFRLHCAPFGKYNIQGNTVIKNDVEIGLAQHFPIIYYSFWHVKKHWCWEKHSLGNGFLKLYMSFNSQNNPNQNNKS